jgi:hypothetical protein
MARPYRRRAVSSVCRAYSSDPLERIETIGGVNPDQTRWKLSQPAAIAAIEAGTDEFFITENGCAVELIVVAHAGQKYLSPRHEHPAEWPGRSAPG